MRGRVLLLIGAIILLAVVVVVVFFVLPENEQEAEPEGGETAQIDSAGESGTAQIDGQATPIVRNMVNIVVAIQDLPRGLTIPEDGIALQPWPEDALPEAGNYFVDVNDVIGRIARTDIFRGSPVLGRQVVDNLYEIAQTGSDAAALMAGLPADRSWTAISVPLDPTGIGQVAYGLQPGDYVDVIMSFLFVDVDEEFQTRLPNTISVITRAETGELVIGAPRSGRTEPSTLSPEGVLVGPSETAQRPRLVTQRTVTDAWVLHVGYFPPGGNIVGATPTPIAVEAPPPAPGDPNAQQAPPTAVPTATPYAPTIITLAVTPQDALALVWAIDSQIPITLALRAAGDRSVTQTEAVSLQYMIQNFDITQPASLPFSLEPPIRSVRRYNIGSLSTLLAEEAAIPTE
jgi:pilus assembly protein CpaB